MKQGTNEAIASQLRNGYTTGVAKEVVEWKLITKAPVETETVASYIEKGQYDDHTGTWELSIERVLINNVWACPVQSN